MISIKINDINNFMQNLLVKDTFDSFLICSGEIITGSSFSFDGHINKAFFDKDEIENFTEDFATWKNLRNFLPDLSWLWLFLKLIIQKS